MADDILYAGCWLSHNRHGESIGTSPGLIESQYMSLQMFCFYPMCTEMIPDERQTAFRPPAGAGSMHFKPSGRESITTLRLRAYRNEVDAKLDYALRLAAGLDVKQDIQAALKQLAPITNGQYPDAVRSFAASLACACLQYNFEMSDWTLKMHTLCLEMANESLERGLFSFSAFLSVAYFLQSAPRREIRAITALYPRLIATYLEAIKEAGSRHGLGRQCAGCGRRSKHRSELKACTGPCKELKKPMYCGRECQKSDWKNHRRWYVAQPAGNGVPL
ncbi:hypothetical protein M413DRAFT_138498 [Hebeloma cylindrosporum]|uniref:MYND-type domain-containing protein n=1 Tax=Hebeloma cylindrosporum TaxID=76867 RepID=A0A0C2YLA6_HEBCY|nr:hypothetical protein M413DRAFT_138498 [Hebeloma cylindrosporum h7]